MSLPPSRYPNVDWLPAVWQEHGREIHERGLGSAEVMRLCGISEQKARRLVRVIAEHGPPEAKSRPEGRRIHLVIGDIHIGAVGDVTPQRALWLARMIADIRPDVVICVGDAADMPSLSGYDKGKRCFEGRRYWRDVARVRRFLDLLHRELARLVWSGRMVLCLGNHPDRISKAIEENAAILEGTIGLEDLGFEEHGWEVFPYRKPVLIDGIRYVHFIHGRSPKASAGIHQAYQMLKNRMTSHTVGHSHISQYSKFTQEGVDLRGLVAGVFHCHEDDYAAQSNSVYWRGIKVCRHVDNGVYDLDEWSMRRIRDEYEHEDDHLEGWE